MLGLKAQLYCNGWIAAQNTLASTLVTVFQLSSISFLPTGGTKSMAVKIQQIVPQEEFFPSELVNHALCWNGPNRLRLHPDRWPRQVSLSPNDYKEAKNEEKGESCAMQTCLEAENGSLVPLDHYSSFTRLKRITAWMLRFITHCHTRYFTAR